MKDIKATHKFDRINVEISNVCNLKCSFCPSVERGEQILSVANFSHIVSEIGPHTKEIVLHLLGEPLGHPAFLEILNAAETFQVPVNVVTNGILLVGERPKELLHPIVRQVSFSLQSFEANFPTQSPKAYIQRIKSFTDRALTERPDLYINLRFWDLNDPANPSRGGGALRETLAEVYGFDWADVAIDLRRRKNWNLSGRLYLHFDSRFEWPYLARSILQETGTCKALKGHVGIHANGVVVPCCLDHNADIPLGNIFESSFAEILAMPRAVAMREGFRKGVLTEELCKRCGFIERFAGATKVRL